MIDKYTLVSIVWAKRKRNHRLLFGRYHKLARLGWRSSLAAFTAGEIFGYERWRANKYGTIEWQIFIAKAGAPGEQISSIPGINPGACLLLSAHGKRAAKRLLAALDEVSKHHPLDSIREANWRRLNTFLLAGFDTKNLYKYGPF